MNLLTKYAISGLPVIAAGHKLVGILTEKDVLKILEEKVNLSNDRFS